MRSRLSSTWMRSPFLHKAHGDHMSPFSLPLPYCLHYSFTDNKPIVLPLLSTPFSQSFLTQKTKKSSHFTHCFISSNTRDNAAVKNTHYSNIISQSKRNKKLKWLQEQLLCDTLHFPLAAYQLYSKSPVYTAGRVQYCLCPATHTHSEVLYEWWFCLNLTETFHSSHPHIQNY